MKQIVIENPVINCPFVEPMRHFRFSDIGITNEIIEQRRSSSYFIPIAQPKKKKKGIVQLTFETEWTSDRIKENEFINAVRQRVSLWRKKGYPCITSTTRRLLEYWNSPTRERKLFFCQIEALETAIYIFESAKKCGDSWIENDLRRANEDANPLLNRIAFKMATGSGKTVVMAMLIAWQSLNKFADPRDRRFSDTFLIVTPGITIKDRLRVLLPNDPQNYYRQRDIIPDDWLVELQQARILITNFHSFKLREKASARKLTKSILGQGECSPFTETPNEMVRRVCRDFGNKKNIIVINDEAHHCYRRKFIDDDIKLRGEERKEAKRREEEARVWISGLEAIKAKIGVKTVFDLSATPFFLRGSGYPEGTLFPWVVSDFSLIDAIESGIVKVPRVPVADDSMSGEQPTYRDLWVRIHDQLPRKGRRTEAVTGEPKLPVELQGALHSLYSNYENYYRQWEQSEAKEKGMTPPVFIVVCNNTNVSKLVFDYVAGWEKTLADGSIILVPGQLPIFNNVAGERWAARPNTILIDSQQLESGEAMSTDFKKMAARQIEEFKNEYQTRFPGRDAGNLTDEDLLREVMNTVGKSGKLGEHVRCVISVSMLTEGWDANTVTHILGVRAFSTQLLCEQVIGRGLRRVNYMPEKRTLHLNGKVISFESFPTEYAEVYGVPFSFIPCSGSNPDPKPGPVPKRVRALDERVDCEITFPRLIGYRYELPSETLKADFDEDCTMVLSTHDVPTRTENAPIVGETSIHTLYDLTRRRRQEVIFLLAKLTLERYFSDGNRNNRPWLFPQLLAITKRWLEECLIIKDNAFVQLLLLLQYAHNASDKIYRAIVASTKGEKVIRPILKPYDTIGSTRYVDFTTTRSVYATDPYKCHISHVVSDTDTWEQKMAQVLEEMDEVICYVKNHNLGFIIPYTIDGTDRGYIPDFIVRIGDRDTPMNLILEVTGERKKEKEAKVATARHLWVPAVNNHGGFGRWAFVEISDPWDCKETILALLQQERIGEGRIA